MTDDGAATAERVDAVNLPASVDTGGRCGVSWSFDHHVNSGSVGVAFLTPTAQSTATIADILPSPGVVSIDHIDTVIVTPSPLAANQVPVSHTTTATQTTANAAPVVSSVEWTDFAQFQGADLCSASATSTLVVNLMGGSTCTITDTTNYPTCVASR